MSTNANLEIAYWTVIKELEPASRIPVALLESARLEFMERTGDPRAGDVFYKHLKAVEWDWPAWHAFSDAAGLDNIPRISVSVSGMDTESTLMTLTVRDLRRECKSAGIDIKGKATKRKIVSALLQNIDDERGTLVSTSRSKILRKRFDKCRREMARRLGARIEMLSHNLMRYEQLGHFEDWEFHWGGHADENAPAFCKKFDGRVLPAIEAKEMFPVLPCEHLQCLCCLYGRHAKI